MTLRPLTLVRFVHTTIPQAQMLAFSDPCVVVQNMRQAPNPVVLGGACTLNLPTQPTLAALRCLLQNIGVPRQKLTQAHSNALFGATGYARSQDSHLYTGCWPTMTLDQTKNSFEWTEERLDDAAQGYLALQLVSQFCTPEGQAYPQQLERLDKATTLLSKYIRRPIHVLNAGEADRNIASPVSKQKTTLRHPITPKR